MDKAERRRREDYGNAVEYLCTHLEELSDRVAVGEWFESLKALAGATPFTEPWYAEVRKLHDLSVEKGVLGGLGLTNPMGDTEGTGSLDWPGRRQLRGWVCPADVCTRVELDSETGSTPPDCLLHTKPMKHVEV